MDGETSSDSDGGQGMEEDLPQDSTNPSYFAEQISLTEYEKQKSEYTKSQVNALINSPQYQRKHNSCTTCWSLWHEGMCNADCMECGGFPLQRPCPICQGKCQAVWDRDIDVSHSTFQAHWVGECKLPWEERQLHLHLLLTEPDDETILDGMDALSTQSS